MEASEWVHMIDGSWGCPLVTPLAQKQLPGLPRPAWGPHVCLFALLSCSQSADSALTSVTKDEIWGILALWWSPRLPNKSQLNSLQLQRDSGAPGSSSLLLCPWGGSAVFVLPIGTCVSHPNWDQLLAEIQRWTPALSTHPRQEAGLQGNCPATAEAVASPREPAFQPLSNGQGSLPSSFRIPGEPGASRGPTHSSSFSMERSWPPCPQTCCLLNCLSASVVSYKQRAFPYLASLCQNHSAVAALGLEPGPKLAQSCPPLSPEGQFQRAPPSSRHRAQVWKGQASHTVLACLTGLSFCPSTLWLSLAAAQGAGQHAGLV